MNNIVCPKLTHHQVAALIKLVEAQTSLGVGYIHGADLYEMETALKNSMAEEASGFHDLNSGGSLNFSLFHSGNKVYALKAFREASGFGLKEAFDIINKAKKVEEGLNTGLYQLIIRNSTTDFFDQLTAASAIVSNSSNPNRVFTRLSY